MLLSKNGEMLATTPGAELDEAAAKEIVTAAARRYFAARRNRIDAFVAAHFSWRGAFRLHRHAIGWDVLRAPANLVLEAPNFVLRLFGAAARKLGAKRVAARLAGRTLLFETDLAREIAWLIQTELLELPCAQGGREAQRDALAEAILAEPRVADRVRRRIEASGPVAGEARFRRLLEQRLSTYTDSRSAVAESTTSLLMLGVGAASLKRLTPGAMALGPGLAAMIAQHAAIASFPLGAGLGALWYGFFPAAPSPLLVGGITAGLFAALAGMAPFVGIVADPLQRALGLHHRRLGRLVDALEREFDRPGSGHYVPKDHYAARLLGLLDLLSGAGQMLPL